MGKIKRWYWYGYSGATLSLYLFWHTWPVTRIRLKNWIFGILIQASSALTFWNVKFLLMVIVPSNLLRLYINHVPEMNATCHGWRWMLDWLMDGSWWVDANFHSIIIQFTCWVPPLKENAALPDKQHKLHSLIPCAQFRIALQGLHPALLTFM